MKNLVIVESPSKSKTIEKYLGKDYKVVSSKGHIRDLATSGKEGLGVDVDDQFQTKYIINKDKKDVVKSLKNDIKKAQHVFLATDPDREGEAISWHLAQELELDINEENRVVFNEITKEAVKKAFDSPRKLDMDLVKSQETRRIVDRIIGFKLSKLLKSKIRSKSAGRVQSVALKMIVEKEKEIGEFVAEEYWSITALFNESKKDFEAKVEKYQNKKLKIESEEQTDQILKAIEGELQLVDIQQKTRKKESKLVFITSTLQQEAATKLNFNSKKTMRVAQKLYEGVQLEDELEGLITYMRTDSTRLSQSFVESALSYIESEYGKKYVGKYRAVKANDNTQDAHEGIRMTDVTKTPDSIKKYLTPDEFRLYSLIYARTLASLMSGAKQETVAYTFEKNDYQLISNGIKMVFDGYTKVYGPYETNKDTILPELELNQMVTPKSLNKQQHFTQPPLRYNEARLIKALEENGIGRPSTYSFIMDTIVSRGYVEYKAMSEGSKSKVFVPTDQGLLTNEKLAENFSGIINVKYTANMERELDEIAEGKEDHIAALRDFYDRFDPLVKKAYETMEKAPNEYIGEECPEDKGQLIYRYGRFGKFIACENYPTCKYHRPLANKVKEPAKETGEMCPECGKPLVYRKSRYGSQFVACSGFPKCRYIKPNSTISAKQLKEQEESANNEQSN